MNDRIVELEKKAAVAAARVAEAKQRIQAKCTHPLKHLSLDYSGVTSYVGLITTHGVTIRCSNCQGSFRNELVIHADP